MDDAGNEQIAFVVETKAWGMYRTYSDGPIRLGDTVSAPHSWPLFQNGRFVVKHGSLDFSGKTNGSV